MLEDKIKYSIELLKKAEPLALRMNEDGFHLAFSGGKDSQVLYEIAKLAGVKFKAHFQVTTLDPPQLTKFIRKNYPDVEWHLPKINFYKLIIKKHMLPLRYARFCCAYLKEQAGAGTVTLIGIRKAESVNRRERSEFSFNNKEQGLFDQWNNNNEVSTSCINGKDKVILSPILNWSNADVWNFIRGNNIEYCELYDMGFHRIGCVFCPMAGVKEKARERKMFPGIEKAIKKSIQQLVSNSGYTEFDNVDDIFNWWVTNKSVKEFAGDKKQLKLDI